VNWANENGRHLVDHYLTILHEQYGGIVPFGGRVTPPWGKEDGDKFGFMSASKPGIHRNAITGLAAAVIAAGLVVRVWLDG
jgi:hypothetical protein